jgi:integrase
MLQMAWDHGYRRDNPVRGIKLKGVPAKPIVVATKDQFLRVYDALPHQPAKVLARLGLSSGARLCELISFIPEDFDFGADMLSVRRSTVEVTAKYHPTGDRFLTREYTKNGAHRRFKIDHPVSGLVQEHIALHGIGPVQVIFPVRLFASTEAAGRDRLTPEEIDARPVLDPGEIDTLVDEPRRVRVTYLVWRVTERKPGGVNGRVPDPPPHIRP